MAVEVTQNLTQVTISSAGVAGVSGTSGTSGTFGNVLSSSFYISGSIIPNVADGEATSSFSLGSQTNAWKDLWISEGTIYFIASNLQTQSISLNENNEIVLSSFNLNTASLITTASYNEFTSSYGDFTSSYLLVSASIASRLDAATNEQDLSTYLSQSVFNTFTSSYEYYSSSVSDRIVGLESLASFAISGSGTSGTSGLTVTGSSGSDGTSGTSGTSFSGSIDLDSLNSFTSSIDTRVIALENFSSSLIVTGSGTSGTSGIDGSSGTTGTSGTSGTSFSGSLDLESINSFTSSIGIRVEALEDFTSSFATTGVYVNVINPLEPSDTITITSTNTNVDILTANALSVTGSVSGDGFDKFATTGSNSFIGDQQITGSVYIDVTGDDKRIYFSHSGDTNTYIGTTMGFLNVYDGVGYIQLDAQNQDGSGNYAYLILNANNDNSLFSLGDSTFGRINATINLSTSGSFNISTDNNTATLLLDGVSYDAHLATTGSNNFVGDQQITGSLNVSGNQSMIVLPNHTGEPSNPPSGALYFNTVNSHFYGWNGEQWKQLDN